MDFFARQDLARRKTGWLVAYFIFAVGLTIAAIYLVCAFLFLREGGLWNLRLALGTGVWNPDVSLTTGLWNLNLALGTTVATLLVILVGSISKTVALRQGGGVVARSLGGRLIQPNTTDLDERKLLNVVEEMAIASGTPVPEVYLLAEENGINAFAAGHSPTDAAIGVTLGCLKLLKRDELQGVIAHEFSHILNGDMRLNLQLMGIVHGILCLAILGRILLYSGSRRHHAQLGARGGRGGNPLPLLGLALIIIGSIGVFFGRLIKSAASRQREYLADAAAVQFTRNPAGLASALKKIGGLASGSRLQTARAEEASHLFFGNGLGEAWLGLMATHPPLADRIRAIEPDFDGHFTQVEPVETVTSSRLSPPPLPPTGAPALEDLIGRTAAASGFSVRPIAPDQALPQTGTPTPQHLEYAIQWRSSLSEPLQQAAHEPLSATALIYCLLLRPDPAAPAVPAQELLSGIAPAVRTEIERLLPEVARLDHAGKLPLVDLSLNALRQMAPSDYAAFSENLQRLVEHDREIDLFEYALRKIVIRHLDPHFTPVRKPVVQYYAGKALLPDCAVLLSGLARLGEEQPAQIAQAFQAGTRLLQAGDLQMVPPDQCGLAQLDQALNRLALAVPQIKKRALLACAHTVAADGLIQPPEAELLRAIGDTLDCPMPPFIDLPHL